MSRANLLAAHTANTRGAALAADYDGRYLEERRVWLDPGSTMGGATIKISIRTAGDSTWIDTGIVFTTLTDEPQLLDLQPGDEISAIVSGGSSASITIGIS
jgi:hypothetical protein